MSRQDVVPDYDALVTGVILLENRSVRTREWSKSVMNETAVKGQSDVQKC